jgi:cell division protease FtsH
MTVVGPPVTWRGCFLGRDIGEQRDYSEQTAEAIAEEVRRLIDEAHARCRAVLAAHRDKLAELATVLIEDETLDGDALQRVLGPAESRVWSECRWECPPRHAGFMEGDRSAFRSA